MHRLKLVFMAGVVLLSGCASIKSDNPNKVAWSEVTRAHLMTSIDVAIELYDTQKAVGTRCAKPLEQPVAFRDGGSFGVAVQLAGGETIFIIVCHPSIWTEANQKEGRQQIVCSPFCDPATAVPVESDRELSDALLELLDKIKAVDEPEVWARVREALKGQKVKWE